jgi:hypothetical protein
VTIALAFAAGFMSDDMSLQWRSLAVLAEFRYGKKLYHTEFTIFYEREPALLSQCADDLHEKPQCL